MLKDINSNYDCSQSGDDLHQLIQELESLRGQGEASKDIQEQIHRLENQISFIRNKCDIP
jgi:peptidoglycan hydrolase CwlO-like protein